MTLVDTSVWVEHFRGDRRALRLSDLLEDGQVLMHPSVLGELALGGLGPKSAAVIDDLMRLPTAPEIPNSEVLALILDRRLAGNGIGWVDAHLVASALVGACNLWTADMRLEAVARQLGVPTG